MARIPRSRALGCLLYLLVLVVVLIVLSVLFGSFQKGTQSKGASFTTRTISVACQGRTHRPLGRRVVFSSRDNGGER
jgi:hypothetical protein